MFTLFVHCGIGEELNIVGIENDNSDTKAINE